MRRGEVKAVRAFARIPHAFDETERDVVAATPPKRSLDGAPGTQCVS
jgi:hypothetical protein